MANATTDAVRPPTERPSSELSGAWSASVPPITVASAGNGSLWARSRTAGDAELLDTALDDAAELLGTTGITTARRERHQAQRVAFLEWHTDFTARRGWTIQRGLYRPDAPQLPLQYAA